MLAETAERLRAKAGVIDRELSSGHSVYVHCAHGRQRSAAAVASFLVIHKGLPLRDAWAAVAALRPCAHVGERNTFAREVHMLATEASRARS